MITASQLTLAGKINKTHGVGGEMSISFFSPEIADSVEIGTCMLMRIDGIFTPFYVNSVRPRSTEALLISIDGVDSQQEAAAYVGNDVYLQNSHCDNIEQDSDEDDGFYAGQLIGFKAYDENGELIGEIIDIDDATENALFVIETPNNDNTKTHNAYIPIADEFITDISTDNQTITFDLPEGLLSL